MHPLAALLAILPGWASHLGRDLPHFQDAASELYDIAGTNRANWAATPPRRQALAVAATVAQLAPPPKLTVAVPPANAFAFAALYRLTRDQALPSYFELAWRRAYPGLRGLMGPSCSSTDALQLAGRLLAAPPSESGLDSLAARVHLLLPHLDTAVLRAAPAADRVTKMEGLLKGSEYTGLPPARQARGCLARHPSDASHRRPNERGTATLWLWVSTWPLWPGRSVLGASKLPPPLRSLLWRRPYFLWVAHK